MFSLLWTYGGAIMSMTPLYFLLTAAFSMSGVGSLVVYCLGINNLSSLLSQMLSSNMLITDTNFMLSTGMMLFPIMGLNSFELLILRLSSAVNHKSWKLLTYT